jgi:hypothetical protein
MRITRATAWFCFVVHLTTYYPSIYLEGLSKSTKNVSQGNRGPQLGVKTHIYQMPRNLLLSLFNYRCSHVFVTVCCNYVMVSNTCYELNVFE